MLNPSTAIVPRATVEDIVRKRNEALDLYAGALRAIWGLDGIPSRWLKPLAWGDRIMEDADYWYGRVA